MFIEVKIITQYTGYIGFTKDIVPLSVLSVCPEAQTLTDEVLLQTDEVLLQTDEVLLQNISIDKLWTNILFYILYW